MHYLVRQCKRYGTIFPYTMCSLELLKHSYTGYGNGFSFRLWWRQTVVEYNSKYLVESNLSFSVKQCLWAVARIGGLRRQCDYPRFGRAARVDGRTR